MTLHVGLHQIVQGRKLGFSPTRLHQEARPRGIGDILLVNLEVKARSPQYRPTRHLAQGRQLPHQPQGTGARSIFVGGDRGDRGHNSQLNRPTQNPNSKIPNPKSQIPNGLLPRPIQQRHPQLAAAPRATVKQQIDQQL